MYFWGKEYKKEVKLWKKKVDIHEPLQMLVSQPMCSLAFPDSLI